jgi:hypothetical protein
VDSEASVKKKTQQKKKKKQDRYQISDLAIDSVIEMFVLCRGEVLAMYLSVVCIAMTMASDAMQRDLVCTDDMIHCWSMSCRSES